MDDQIFKGAGPIEHVREGMKVVDVAGDEIGSVVLVTMGDAASLTTRGNETQPSGGIIGAVGRVFTDDRPEPNVAGPARDRLIRGGFVKVDGPGLMDTDRYVRAERIASVQGNVVTLTVRKDQLPVED